MVKGQGGFIRKGAYKPEILNPFIDESHFNLILDKANHITERLYSMKRMQDNLGISKYKQFLTLVSMICMIASFWLFYDCLITENLDYEISAYALFASSLVIFSCLMLYEAQRSSKS